MFVIFSIFYLLNFPSAFGHGRLLNPPSRSSYRHFANDPTIFPFVKELPDVDDQLFCGEIVDDPSVEFIGKCGVCGDSFGQERPRDNEWGGRYGKSGLIPRNYSEGGEIEFEVQTKLHHGGWMEFKLCQMTREDRTEPEECFNSKESLIHLENEETRFRVPPRKESRNLDRKLIESGTGETKIQGWLYKVYVLNNILYVLHLIN